MSVSFYNSVFELQEFHLWEKHEKKRNRLSNVAENVTVFLLTRATWIPLLYQINWMVVKVTNTANWFRHMILLASWMNTSRCCFAIWLTFTVIKIQSLSLKFIYEVFFAICFQFFLYMQYRTWVLYQIYAEMCTEGAEYIYWTESMYRSLWQIFTEIQAMPILSRQL